jgi:hypothetical protein
VLRHNESFEDVPCDGGPHEFCSECLAAWVAAEVSQGKSAVCCPGEGCTRRLSPNDVARLADAGVAARFREIMSTDFSVKTRELLADPDHAEWLQNNTKECPACHQLIERITGCDDMHCLCGQRFCYRCGSSAITDPASAAAASDDVERCEMCRDRLRMYRRIHRRGRDGRGRGGANGQGGGRGRGYGRGGNGRGGRGNGRGGGGNGRGARVRGGDRDAGAPTAAHDRAARARGAEGNSAAAAPTSGSGATQRESTENGDDGWIVVGARRGARRPASHRL